MLISYINHPQTYLILSSPTWIEIFNWLKDYHPLDPGEYPIRNHDIYANVIQTKTLPRTQCSFESHHQYIDLHYCLAGQEIIEWLPVQELTAHQTESNPTQDYTLFSAPASAPSLTLNPGMFAIFFPGEAHMPKITPIHPAPLSKIVVKINTALLIV